MNLRLLLLRERVILVPGEVISCPPGTPLYHHLLSNMTLTPDFPGVFWWAPDAEQRDLPAVYCQVELQNSILWIRARQPASCFTAGVTETEASGTLLPFRREEDKELSLRITDLLKEIKDMSPSEARGHSHFPWFPGLEFMTLSPSLRLELLSCSSVTDMQERLLPELKRAVATLHATEHLMEVLRGEAYLRPDAT